MLLIPLYIAIFPLEDINDLKYPGVIKPEALTCIRGRSIPKPFITCDEDQNLSPHMIKPLVTRETSR